MSFAQKRSEATDISIFDHQEGQNRAGTVKTSEEVCSNPDARWILHNFVSYSLWNGATLLHMDCETAKTVV